MLFIMIKFYIFLIRPVVEARAEIHQYFCSFFGSNENFKICFWDLLTFNNRHYNLFIFLKLIFDPFKCVMGFNFTNVTVPGRFLFGHNRKPIAGIGWKTETVKGEKNRQKSCNCFWIGPGLSSGVKTLTKIPMLIKVEWFT